MIEIARLIAGFSGTWLIGIGSVVIAQAGPADLIERGLIGASVMTLGVVIVRMFIQASERVEASWSSALEAAERRADKAETRAHQAEEHVELLRRRLNTCQATLAKHGLLERRSDGDDS